MDTDIPAAKKPKTGGRKKGTKNKNTSSVKRHAQKHGPAAIRRLVWLSKNASTHSAQVAAANSLLDRGYGKPVAPQVHTGVDDGPIQVQEASPLETARRSAFLLALAKRQIDSTEPGDDDTVQ